MVVKIPWSKVAARHHLVRQKGRRQFLLVWLSYLCSLVDAVAQQPGGPGGAASRQIPLPVPRPSIGSPAPTARSKLVPPQAPAQTTPPAIVSTGPGYVCRTRNGDASQDAKMSEHATGNAVDIMALGLADKRQIGIVAVTDERNPDHRLLMALRLTACGYFTTVLGPGANTAHANYH
jgi:Extensin-like protein C-terminus